MTTEQTAQAEQAETKPVLIEEIGDVTLIKMNRPEKLNAWSAPVSNALNEFFQALNSGEYRTRAIVLTGEGRAFCAGMDLRAVSTDDGLREGLPLRLLESLARLTVKLRALPQVVIARVNGAAIGGGCGLACACDLCVTHADSKMGFPEVDLGVCPAVVAPWLVRKIGPARARAVLLQGGIRTGADAHALGIADHLAASLAELDTKTDEIAGRIASGGPGAMRATKELLNSLDASLDERLVLEGAALSARVLSTPEAQAMLRSKLPG